MLLSHSLQVEEHDSLTELWNRVEDIPYAVRRPIHVEKRDEDGNKFKEKAPFHEAIIDAEEGNVHTVASDRYSIVQHNAALRPLFEFVRDQGIEVTGDLISTKSRGGAPASRLHVLMMFQGDEFAYESETGDEFRFGMWVTNSLDRSSALSAKGFAGNLVCLNGLISGDILGEARIRHTGDVSEKLGKLEGFMQVLTANASDFIDALDAGLDVEVETWEREPLIVGAGIPQRHAGYIVEEFEDYLEPSQKNHADTQRGVFDAATNYLTHEYDVQARTVERQMQNAVELLTEDKEELVDQGEELLAEAEA